MVDLDLENFCARVHHDRLMARVAERVADKRGLRLLRAVLNAGLMDDGLVRPIDEGTPQGNPWSPLLSNLGLDELDQELSRRGHRCCRYGDDGNISVRSHRAGERVMASIAHLRTRKLRLKVNEAKSAGARPAERKFLGFRLSNDGRERQIAPQTLARFKARVREQTRRSRGGSLPKLIEPLAPYLRGGRNYLGCCHTPQGLSTLDAWIRRRLRLYLGRPWKTGRNRVKELRRRGGPKFKAAVAAGSPRGFWRRSSHPAVHQALRNRYFDALGLPRVAGSSAA